ncbi:MAG: DNA repair protein RecN [Ignavibacterium sp.]
MLKSLFIKDYALIENISVEFGKGLNIITGETGAGKSILIDAMSLLLGERATNEVIRKGTDKSIVEGIFNVSNNKKIKNILDENEIETNDELIIRRELSIKGSNRCFVNDTPVNLNLIKELGNLLVDLHGQHEHQSLLRTETHIEFLDDFTNNQNLVDEFRKEFNTLNLLISQLNSLRVQEKIIKEKKDLYEFQMKEIDSISPQIDEDETIESELNILENSEKLFELTNSIYEKLYEDEDAAFVKLSKVKNQIDEIKKIDKIFSDTFNEIENALTLIKDAASFVRDYKSKIDLDINSLEKKRERLASLNLLKKKFGGSLKYIIEYREKIYNEVQLADNFEEEISKLEKEIEQQRIKCGELAHSISEKRKDAIKIIKKELVEVLKELGISNGSFEIKISQELLYDKDIGKTTNDKNNFIIFNNKKYSPNSRGFDEVEFFISTNLGEDPKPLAKVASGGEVSRIMLSLKTILAKNDKLPLLIFDEIDTGVSGRIAQKVGYAIKSLSEYHQIIAITHLPQIAGFADYHYAVEKNTLDGRVVSSIRKLNDKERVEEVAKLMSGETITEASLKGAKELINTKHK